MTVRGIKRMGGTKHGGHKSAMSKCQAKAAHRKSQAKHVAKIGKKKQAAKVKKSTAKKTPAQRKKKSPGVGKHGHQIGRPREAC